MAPLSAYPRSTLRSLLKAWSPTGDATLSANFDALAFVAYLSFLQRLAKESRAVAEDSVGLAGRMQRRGTAARKGKRVVVGKRDIRKAKRAVLKGLKA